MTHYIILKIGEKKIFNKLGYISLVKLKKNEMGWRNNSEVRSAFLASYELVLRTSNIYEVTGSLLEGISVLDLRHMASCVQIQQLKDSNPKQVYVQYCN